MTALYKKIYSDIKKEIDENKIKPGEYIDSEYYLIEKYDCSRHTVRKAMYILQQRGYIEKSRGKRSIVKERNTYTFPTSKIESFKELNKRKNLNAKTTLLSIKDVCDMDNKYSRIFDNCIQVKRLREIEGEKVVLDIDYFDSDMIKGLNKEICENSIYQYIEDKLKIEIGYSKKEITVEKPTKDDLKYLDIDENDLLVIISSYTYTNENKIFQSTISKHRYDKFKFESFANR